MILRRGGGGRREEAVRTDEPLEPRIIASGSVLPSPWFDPTAKEGSNWSIDALPAGRASE